MAEKRVSHEALADFAASIFVAAGVSRPVAEIVALHLATAEARDRKSHGVSRVPRYVEQLRKGQILPDREPQIVLDRGHLLLVDGGMNFGQVTMTRAIELAESRVPDCGIVTVFIRGCNHIGEAGQHLIAPASRGRVGRIDLNVVGIPRVAPFGGLEARTGTNVMAWGFPREDFPLIIDASSCMIVEGRINVARAEGVSLPHPFLLQPDGSRTSDPKAHYAIPPAAIPPLGDDTAGQKGSAYLVGLDLFAGILSGSGFAQPGAPLGRNGICLTLLDPAVLCGEREYESNVDSYVNWIRSSGTRNGFEEVLLPGEKEYRLWRERKKEGVPVAEGVWQELIATASRAGVPVPAV